MARSDAGLFLVRLVLVISLAFGVAIAIGAGLAQATPPEDEGDGRAQVLTVRGVAPLIACDGCELATTPGAPVNARASVEMCGSEAVCVNGGDVLITVTYAWPGGDPSTGLADGAQTCIRWFAEPATLLQRPGGYAFGGDCSTNESGTDAEFAFIAPGTVTFCAQVDAFRGSTDLGSSNLACLELEPPPDKEFPAFEPVEFDSGNGNLVRVTMLDPISPATVRPGSPITAVVEFETVSSEVAIVAHGIPAGVGQLGFLSGPAGTVNLFVTLDPDQCMTGLAIEMHDGLGGELLAGGTLPVQYCAIAVPD